nr:MAG TPA: hypothetical protein [Caudoviricetes sp.]
MDSTKGIHFSYGKNLARLGKNRHPPPLKHTPPLKQAILGTYFHLGIFIPLG